MSGNGIPSDEATLTGHDYVPGQCNLGNTEITRRRRVGYIGLVLSLVFIVVSEIFDFPKGYKLLLFIPMAYAFTGFFQARQHFCVLYGFMGLARTSDTGKYIKIKDMADHRKDLRMVAILLLKAIAAGAVVTAIYYLLP